ncbi:cytochrome C biogenesis protein CcdA [Virgisporangium aliadipatigenens]|uniref:Cytochrome C biogenesis protein CcdA n=1 Tax=Virgisporangium aliadipatigenens TaxID=741659 RepID=A0A8J3YT91_9ACTN|nr:cytochrome c biogenesis protein CcdA [Virgisporangium aliadipatigenens]GIJ49475.1 cytochrome C biogenesis protein CcdA [Virgisporangium aliadipatigenens]
MSTAALIPLAFTAGMLAAANPCGFALLPAYLSVLVARDGAGSVWRALTCTAAMTLGFVAVFAAFGLLLAPVAGWLQPRLPWFTVVLGVALVVAGGWLVAGRTLPGLVRPGRAPALTGTVASVALFGAAYALASLSCTIAPFLAIVVASLRAGSPGQALLLFVVYAAGMGATVGVLAVAVAAVRTPLVRRLRGASAAVSRVAGGLMACTGAYVAYYGWYELSGAAPDDPVVGAATGMQARAAAALESAGPVTILAALAAVFATGVLLARRRRA